MSDGQSDRTMYQDIDRATNDRLSKLVASLDFWNNQPGVERAKQIMLDLLAIQEDATVLDAGCGLGDNIPALASKVGDGGRVVAADISASMIGEAQHRTAQLSSPPEFVVADLCDLPIASKTFDAVRCERTLEWIGDPRQAFEELVRVLKPGGRLVIGSGDHGAAIFGAGDPEQLAILTNDHLADVPSPMVARMLPTWYRNYGLTDIQVEASHVLVGADDLKNHPQGHGHLDSVLEKGLVTEDQHRSMIEEAERAFETNSAFQFGVMIIVAGTK